MGRFERGSMAIFRAIRISSPELTSIEPLSEGQMKKMAMMM